MTASLLDFGTGYHKDDQVHDVPDAEEVRESDFEDLQGLFDGIVEDERAVDDAAAQDEEVPAVDVLDQLHRLEAGVLSDAAGGRKLKREPVQSFVSGNNPDSSTKVFFVIEAFMYGLPPYFKTKEPLR